MQKIAVLFAFLLLTLAPGIASAQSAANGVQAAHGTGSVRTVSTESWIEEWDPAAQRWVRVDDAQGGMADQDILPVEVTTITTHVVNGQIVARSAETRAEHRTASFNNLSHNRPGVPGSAAYRYGPFAVVGNDRAALVGPTDGRTPRQFDAMMRDFPGLEVIDMVEAPGTSNDIANLALGRRIRAAGLHTHVPAGGSVRSGAVELFLAGETRSIDPGARFAVHSWLDTHGREADDFAPGAPEHRMYLDYYVEMGMTSKRARAFYDMTNSVPHESALWLRSDEMRQWIRPVSPTMKPRSPAHRMLDRVPVLAVHDGGESLPALVDMRIELPQQAFDPLPNIAYADVIRTQTGTTPIITLSRFARLDS
jgi:hypothetical protein